MEPRDRLRSAWYHGITTLAYGREPYLTIPPRHPKVVARGYDESGRCHVRSVEESPGKCGCRRDVDPGLIAKFFCSCCCVFNFEGFSQTFFLSLVPLFPFVQVHIVFVLVTHSIHAIARPLRTYFVSN